MEDKPLSNFAKWQYYCRDLESPQQFVDWTYFWTIASCLQRRVWLGDEGQPIFPNLFVCFVADPGIGKSLAARLSRALILKTFITLNDKMIGPNGQPLPIPQIPFSADSTSPESLIQQLSLSIRQYTGVKQLPDGRMVKIPIPHNSMCLLLSEEMTSLFRANMQDIPTYLNQWWDAQDFHYKTKHQGEDLIKNVCVNLLGCTTPENMKDLMRTGVLDQGFTARAIFVYANKHRQKKLLYEFTPDQRKALEEVRLHCKALLELEGPCRLSDESFEWFNEYYTSEKLEKECLNKDIKLKHYLGRIKTHALKMAMIHHYSEVDTKNNLMYTFKDGTTHPLKHIIQLPSIKMAVSSLRAVEPSMHKALASNTKNPTYDLAMDILEFLKLNGEHKKIALYIMYASKCENKEQFDESMELLKLMQQTSETVKNGAIVVVPKIEVLPKVA